MKASDWANLGKARVDEGMFSNSKDSNGAFDRIFRLKEDVSYPTTRDWRNTETLLPPIVLS